MLRMVLALLVATAVPASAQDLVLVPPTPLTTRPQPVAFSAVERGLVRILIAGARRNFEEALVDYPSARFRNVVAIYANAQSVMPMMCGLVNAKNRMGGYTGWRPFALTIDVFLVDDADKELFQSCIRAWKTDVLDYSAELAAAR